MGKVTAWRWLVLFSALVSSGPVGWAQQWSKLDEGLELARFPAPDSVGGLRRSIYVLRVDPRLWEFRLLCANGCGECWKTARAWAERYELVAAINAGMFHGDGTHVGCLTGSCCQSAPPVPHYQSALAFSPLQEGLPPARLFDLDVTSLDTVLRQYRCVIQNLRLIKSPGENRWKQQPRRWSEAALGEDGKGRILMIFTRAPLSMHDLNEVLLHLPLDLRRAQHLEGGPEAQLFVRCGDRQWELVGSYESGFSEHDANVHAWPVPNVIGLRRR